jgi:hypothetical protein
MAERQGAIPSSLSLAAGQSVRRNAADNAFEAFTAGSGGTVDTANSPNTGEFARFTDSDTIEGRTPVETVIELLPYIYPVGCIYFSTNSTNPATSLGFGTWAAFGAGRVPVGFDSGDADFDTDEETGGSKTQVSNVTVGTQPTFTVNSHTHPLSRTNGWAEATVTSGGNVDGLNTTATTYTATRRVAGTGSVISASTSTGLGLGGATDATSGTATTRTADVSLTNNSTSVLQPYIVVRMWKRTA